MVSGTDPCMVPCHVVAVFLFFSFPHFLIFFISPFSFILVFFFSELVKEQYGFLMKQLEKVLKDYFDLSDRVKEMHSEIFSLKGKLSEAVTLQCVNKECIQRNNGSESASSSTSLIPA